MTEEEVDVVSTIENDEFYKCFLKSTAKNSLLQSLTITEQVKKLGEGIELLSRELQKQVLNKHHDLIRQANHANKLEMILNTMNMHVQNLFANAERLKAQITGPYQALETHTRVLTRLHLASHILRQVNRIQQLAKRLGNTSDPVQKATILQELEQLASDLDLQDVDAVTTELRNIRAQQQKVVRFSSSSLTQGIANENITQTTTALQIFMNLGTIKSAIKNVLDVCLGECRESLKSALDATGAASAGINKNKAGPGRVALLSSQGFRNRVWTDLEKAFSEEISQQCVQVKFLQQTLNNINAYSAQNTDVAKGFWHSLGDCICTEINNAVPAVQQMLESDYPKLLKLYVDMAKKLDYEQFTPNRTILEKLENSYLSSSLSQLLEPTQSMFGQETGAPSHDQIDSLIRTITGVLSVALVEDCLSEKITKNVSKCIRMFGVKTEQQLATGVEAAQVIGTPNAGQQLNVNLSNSLYYLQTQVHRMLNNMKESLSSASVTIILESLQGLDVLIAAILHPLVTSINSTIETIIITIHLEQDWSKLQVPTNRNAISCSPYMRELTQFIVRVYNTYLVIFDSKEVLTIKCSEISIRCIELLVRHSVLIRPISQGGRVRLQVDYAHAENALKILCPYLADLGRPYRLLKSMATLVTLMPNEIVQSQVSGSSVPHSTVLLLLFSFAGAELASPHQNAVWSLAKLSKWLDEHTLESDRLDLIAGALQRYETIIRQKKSVNYDPLYPIMSEFLATAMRSI